MPSKRGGRRANPGGRPPKPIDQRIAFKGKIAIRVDQETALLAQQLMLREWPGVSSVEELIAYAIQELERNHTMNGAIKIQFESGSAYAILPIHEYRNSGPVFRVEDTDGTHLLSAADVRGSWNAWVGDLVDDDQVVDVPPPGVEVY